MKTVIEMALEALESSLYPQQKQLQAITALRQALEQPAQQEPGRNHWEDGDVFERIAAIKEQPAQQKPVAWISKHGVVYPFDAKDEVHPINDLQPLYTSPPAQRTWVGLTHEEVEEVWKRVEASDFRDVVQPFAQAIEVALRSRNENNRTHGA